MNIPQRISNNRLDHGTRVLLRAGLDVPIINGKVQDTFRINQALRTIKYLIEQGARVTVIAHIGRDGESLAPVHAELNKHIPTSFIPMIKGKEVYSAVKELDPGQVLLLENTRIDEREEENVFTLAEELAYQQEIFVMDAFSAAHRAHASTVGLIKIMPTYIGINFYEELVALTRITERISHPAIAFIGGAKLETKLSLIESILDTHDQVYLGGVIANTLLKARGFNIGLSKSSSIEVPQSLIENNNIIIPSTVMVTKDIDNAKEISITEIEDDDIIVDIGEEWIRNLDPVIDKAKSIVWNGPLGWYEKGYKKGSETLAEIVGNSRAYSFLGGGDTLTALRHSDDIKNWSFNSTGGGAVLSYLANGNLVVLDALNSK